MEMSDRSGADAWWGVALDPETRVSDEGDAATSPMTYAGYLGLDALLSAQHPVSDVPDERVFIVVHQLIELAFRQMIFDLGIVAGTLERLLGDDARRAARALDPAPGDDGPDAFWRPALTASARLRHAARTLLPAAMSMLGRSPDGDVLFSTLEFGRFRARLEPSSGFQTAQLRLIQRALGKGLLLDVPLFPAAAFARHYAPNAPLAHGDTAAPSDLAGCPFHVALGDPLVLGEGHATAHPASGTPHARVGALDDLAAALLARLAADARDTGSRASSAPASVPPIDAVAPTRIGPADLDRAVARVRATLGALPDADAHAAAFRAALADAAARENARRDAHAGALDGARRVRALGPTCLGFVFDRLVGLDDALHGPADGSFLTTHRRTVRRHIADGSGTGGGGMPYLVTSQRVLLPLFPALSPWRDAADGAGEDGW